jgi:hypothetical protein
VRIFFHAYFICLTGAGGGSKIEFHRSDGNTQISATGDDTSILESNSLSGSKEEEAKQDPVSDDMAWYGVRVPNHVSPGG